MNRKALSAVKGHQSDVALWTKATLVEGSALTKHFRWVSDLLEADDKADIYKHLTTLPLKAVGVSKEIFTKLSKLFEGKNPSYRVEFVKEDLASDWETYRTDIFDVSSFFRNKGWQTYREAHNSIIVVDLPRLSEDSPVTRREEPYLYFKHPNSIVDVGPDPDNFEWVIFREDGKLYVYDSQFYRVFSTVKNEGYEIEDLLVEVSHDLGYCPAKWYIDEPLDGDMPAVKASAISYYLEAFNWYQMFSGSKKHLDLFAPFPIFFGFKTDCDYRERSRDGLQEYRCDRGFLKAGTDYVRTTGDQIRHCPVCSKKKMHGPGSFVEVDPPSDRNGQADLSNPVGKLDADTGSLGYNVEETARLRADLIQAITGYSGEPMNDQAVNEKQVGSFYEAQTSAINSVRVSIERTDQWCEQTMCRLRYGADFVSLSKSYGTRYYLETPEERLAIYQKAKKDGVDMQILDDLLQGYIQTRWQNNEARLIRERLLTQIDPLRHVTRQEAKELYRDRMIDFKTFFLKYNFSSLISQFERENGSITQFGLALQLDRRVEMIRQTIFGGIQEPAAPVTLEPQNVE